MAKSHNQKAKILVLERMLEKTDKDHVVTMQEILEKLTEYGIRAERKSIYDDFEALRDFGFDIQFKRGKPGGYYLENNVLRASAEKGKNPDRVPEDIDSEDNKLMQGWHYPAGEVQTDSLKNLKLVCSRTREEEIRAYFGDSAEYKEKEPGYLSVTAPLLCGPQFFGWLTAMGRDIRIQKPRKVAAAYRDYLKVLAKDYKGV